MAKPKKAQKPRGKQQVVDLDYLVREIASTDPKFNALVGAAPDAGKTYDPDTKILDLSKLRVNRSYQRLTNIPLIKRIVKKFTENAGMMILVARRKGDSKDVYYIIEGQQRAVSIRARGYKAARCIVINLDDVIEEARTFIAINKERRAVSPAKQFQVEVLAGDNDAATKLNSAVVKAGFVIHEHDGFRRVKAPSKLAKIASVYTFDDVPDFLSVTKSLGAYGAIFPNHKTVHTGLVGGIACMQYAAVQRSGDLLKPVVSATALAKTIGDIWVSEDLGIEAGKTRDAQKMKGTLGDMEYAHVLLLTYNRSASILGVKKLPDNLIFSSAPSSTPQKYLKHLAQKS